MIDEMAPFRCDIVLADIALARLEKIWRGLLARHEEHPHSGYDDDARAIRYAIAVLRRLEHLAKE